MITIPGFGAISLAKLTVKHEDPHPESGVPRKTTFTLTMIDLELGCVIEGSVPIGSRRSTNGSSPNHNQTCTPIFSLTSVLGLRL